MTPTTPAHPRPVAVRPPNAADHRADDSADSDDADGADGVDGVDEQPRTAPEPFCRAVESLRRTIVRAEIRVQPIRAPQRLAPWTYALAADVLDPIGADSPLSPGPASVGTGELANGRLVLLHDPDGVEAWDGVLRLVAFASAELDPDMAGDPLLPEVGWTWLTGALADRGAANVAAGGTVTQTTSTRFGDLHGPRTTVTLELRGSWTATSDDLGPHLLAFGDLLCTAAGLPPEGVTVLPRTP